MMRFGAYILILGFLTGCGYQIAGNVRIPPELKTIAVPVFHNQTFEPVLENMITSAVKQEFLTNSRLEVVNDPGTADLVLKGTIVSFGLTPLSFDRINSVVTEYRVHIRVNVQMEDRPAGEVLWEESGMETQAEYAVSKDTAADRVAQDRAISEAGKQFAENLVSRILEGFE